MMFLGGVFVPLAAMPGWLQVVARLLPLTYAVEALQAAFAGRSWSTAGLDLGALAAFAAVLFGLAVRTLAQQTD
jgi:ABC-2 type transport system permease protein